jgi:hydrogenase maturation protease
MSDILIYGIGNPGRQDDSIGVTFARRFEDWSLLSSLNVDIEYNYQLNIEDAARISAHKMVIFVDASQENIENYCITRVKPKPSDAQLSHSVNPESVLFLCKELFKVLPSAYILHIKGYKWEFGEPVSEKALNNLELAFNELKMIIRQDLTVREVMSNIENIILPVNL